MGTVLGWQLIKWELMPKSLKSIINCFKEDNVFINKKLREVSIEEGRIIATAISDT